MTSDGGIDTPAQTREVEPVAAKRGATGSPRGRWRRRRICGDLQAPRPRALPLLPRDSRRSRRRPGCASEHDGPHYPGSPREKRTIHLRPWLFRVARNESLTLIRNRDETVELTDASVPAAPAADIRAEHREEVRTLVADLASLPESQRSALVLHELSGLSHDEVSEALQRSPRASRQAVYEARLALQDLREGRDLNCDEVRAAVSDGDGRVMRGRKIRSHLRGCRRCSDFALAIDQRKTQLDMLAPSLPAAAATGLIASVLGGGSAAGGLAGAGASAAGVVSGSVALKSAGIIAATLALGVGGASIAGVDVPLVGGSEQKDQSAEHLHRKRYARARTRGRRPGGERRGRSRPKRTISARRDLAEEGQKREGQRTWAEGPKEGKEAQERPACPLQCRRQLGFQPGPASPFQRRRQLGQHHGPTGAVERRRQLRRRNEHGPASPFQRRWQLGQHHGPTGAFERGWKLRQGEVGPDIRHPRAVLSRAEQSTGKEHP